MSGNYYSIAALSKLYRASIGRLEKIVDAARIEPTFRLDGTRYFDDAAANQIAAGLIGKVTPRKDT